MTPETKTALEEAIGRELDETDVKVWNALEEIGTRSEGQKPEEWCLIFGKRCFEMGKEVQEVQSSLKEMKL